MKNKKAITANIRKNESLKSWKINSYPLKFKMLQGFGKELLPETRVWDFCCLKNGLPSA